MSHWCSYRQICFNVGLIGVVIDKLLSVWVPWCSDRQTGFGMGPIGVVTDKLFSVWVPLVY